MPGAAILLIDGERKLLREGQSFKGITLVSARSQIATLDVDGQRQVLGLSRKVTTDYQQPDIQAVTIRRDDKLQYLTSARINGRNVAVLVDTGANLVAMNQAHARQLDIDLTSAIPAQIETASGLAESWVVNLASVEVGGIEVKNVQASVVAGAYPTTILLGMTYLKHVKIEEKQGLMTLSRHR